MRPLLRIAALVPAVVATLIATGAGAQGVPRTGDAPRQPGARPALERLATVVQRQLGLTDEQAARLRNATRQFAVQREQLNRQERATRLELRGAVMAGDSADQDRVAKLLDDMLRFQRRRIELAGEEQRELAKFLTPVQRARFMAMQERALRAAQQMRAQREAQARGGAGRRAVPQP